MRGVPRSLALRAVAFYALTDLIPLYAVYALLFAEHGLSTAEISSLFAIWSVTAFLLEIPSGAWADLVSRRRLLVLSSVIYAAAFATWMVAPGYAGFATGFVLWGVSSSLLSGTFESYLYDELAVVEATPSFPRLLGYARSAAMACNLVATLAAAPLMAVGGYALIGWASVGVALLQGVVGLTLPAAPRASPPEARGQGIAGRYVGMLVAGVGEVRRVRVVRNGMLLAALLLGTTAYDEYFSLLALDKGATESVVPLLVGLTVAGQVVGTALAGRTAHLAGTTLAYGVAAGGALLVLGAFVAQPLAFLAIGLGYGMVGNATVVAESRLQDVIEGEARATVTSVMGVVSEVASVGIFATFALAAALSGISTGFALICSLVLVVAALTPRWLPRRLPTTFSRRPALDADD